MTVEELRKKYPAGTKIRLIKMDDVQAPQKGTIGRVTHVDDIGSIHMHWDGGGSLALIPDVDEFEVVPQTVWEQFPITVDGITLSPSKACEIHRQYEARCTAEYVAENYGLKNDDALLVGERVRYLMNDKMEDDREEYAIDEVMRDLGLGGLK